MGNSGDNLYNRYNGIFLGTVVAVDSATDAQGNKTERDPKQLGRIRLSCAQFSDDASNPIWANVVRPCGGETSVFFTPKVGELVVFAFIAGDVNNPMVLGYAHSIDIDPPIPAPPDVNPLRHAIVSKTFRIDMNEQPGQRKLTLTNRESGDFIEFDAEDKSITISAETGIAIRAKGVIDIRGAQVQIQQRAVQVTKRTI